MDMLDENPTTAAALKKFRDVLIIMRMITAKNKTEWREWLKQNHATEKEVWLIFYKKHTGKPCVFYEEAVEEALCFGWIDSIIKRIDEEKYAQKFTPPKKRCYVGWITSAKREETQLKRLSEAIRLLVQGKELGMK